MLRFAKYRPLVGLVVGITTLGYIAWKRDLIDRADNVYEPPPAANQLQASPIRFEEVHEKMGITFRHEYFSPYRFHKSRPNARTLNTMFPSVSVVDINDDGFYDLYFGAGRIGYPNHLYQNVAGTRFDDVGKQYAIAGVNRKFPTSYAAFGDYNRDGHLDVLIAKWGPHQLFFGQGKDKPFTNETVKLAGYSSNPNAVGVGDLNRDGILDFIFGTFHDHIDIRKESSEWVQFGTRGDKINGGFDDVLWGSADGSFRRDSKNHFLYKSFTHAVGLSDLNRDGLPDVLLANDYATDDLFMNTNGDFREITSEWLPTNMHGYSSMNSEFFDFDGDGRQDIYITNIHKPPFYRKNNVLWQRDPSSAKGFNEVSKNLGVARCGYSWGAKFADLDLDGEADLFVVNGRNRGADLASRDGSYSFWYQRYQQASVPKVLRGIYNRLIYDSNAENLEYSGFERSCVFRQVAGHFQDVSSNSGVTDLENGRGLASVDLDNDGRVDFVVTNVGGPALVYRNISERKGEWIGIDLDGGKGKRIPFGASFRFHDGSGTVVFRELFPTNGMKAQSDPRFVIGLHKAGLPKKLEVVWADGKKETFTNLSANQYNRLVYGTGKAH